MKCIANGWDKKGWGEVAGRLGKYRMERGWQVGRTEGGR